MIKTSRLFAALALVPLIGALDFTSADARGGGSNFMNSPGYQRRLQESRGQVTNQSGSVFAQPYTQPPAVYPRQPAKRLRRR